MRFSHEDWISLKGEGQIFAFIGDHLRPIRVSKPLEIACVGGQINLLAIRKNRRRRRLLAQMEAFDLSSWHDKSTIECGVHPHTKCLIHSVGRCADRNFDECAKIFVYDSIY
jgi:hypothetical protein